MSLISYSYCAGSSNTDYAIIIWIDKETMKITDIYYDGENEIYVSGELVNPISEYIITT